MANSKVISSKSGGFAKGGKSGQIGSQKGAAPQKPGTSAQQKASGGKFLKGGPSGKVGSQSPVMSAKAGRTAR